MAKEAMSMVPPWVRCSICIVACVSVPALVLAAYLGAQISYSLAAVVGAFAIQAANLAFEKKGNIKKWTSKRGT